MPAESTPANKAKQAAAKKAEREGDRLFAVKKYAEAEAKFKIAKAAFTELGLTDAAAFADSKAKGAAAAPSALKKWAEGMKR